MNCQGLGPGGDTTITVGATTANFGTEPGAISGSGGGAGVPDALGALLGTPVQDTESNALTIAFGVSLAGGDLVQITGVCNQLVQVRQSGLVITGRTGNIGVAASPPGSAPIDGDVNQFIVDGAQRTTISNLLFGSGTTEVSLPRRPAFPFAQQGLLTLVRHAQVLSRIPKSRTARPAAFTPRAA